MASVLDTGYNLAVAYYKSIKAQQASQVVVNNNDTDFSTNLQENLSYSDSDKIEYSQSVESLNNPRVQSYIRDYKIDEIVEIASKKFDLPENLIYKIIETESSFDKDAVSSQGASGLMQLMPFNFETYGVTDPFDPYQNIMAGCEHLRKYIDMYDGDLKLGLAAYNAGPGNVNKYGGVPPFQETRNYLIKILGEC